MAVFGTIGFIGLVAPHIARRLFGEDHRYYLPGRAFVGGLIAGTFQAIVTSSIDQMKDYAKLIEQVAGSVDQFTEDNVSDDDDHDWLVPRTRLTKRRRDPLATTVTLRINRIVDPSPPP